MPPRRADAGPPRGILRTHPGADTEHRRVLPTPQLAPSIAHFWWVRWDLPAPIHVETLPHPTVHVVFERNDEHRRAEVGGVPTRRFSRELVGRGHAFGIKFRPGAFWPLSSASMAKLTDRVVPIATVFGAAGDALARELSVLDDFDALVDRAEAFLLGCVSPPSTEAAQIRDLVERMAIDRDLRRVEDAATLVGLDVRTLQRRFRKYVGVGPKWVLQRYRLHEAAVRLEQADPPALAELAAELGYSDQAHFTREFTAVVGRAPSRFATH